LNEDETLAELLGYWTDGKFSTGLAGMIEDSEWLTRVIRQAKAEALEEAAALIKPDSDLIIDIALGGGHFTKGWLRDRATAIRQEGNK
jgi:hypothetical protein